MTSIDYIDLGGYVWKDHVIDRNFDIGDVNSCDFEQFIANISAHDVNRIKSMESTLGFLMHGYKDFLFVQQSSLTTRLYLTIRKEGQVRAF